MLINTGKDLNWIPLSLRKGFDTPKVLYEDWTESTNYGGFYTPKSRTITVVINKSEYYGDNTKSTLAHEFKHYLQDMQVVNPFKPHKLELYKTYSYNKATKLYYTTQWWEMEALLFEYKYAKSHVNDFWLNKLVLPKILDEEAYIQ